MYACASTTSISQTIDTFDEARDLTQSDEFQRNLDELSRALEDGTEALENNADLARSWEVLRPEFIESPRCV